MNACAIIPARGKSKGILRKNVRLLAGKPLVAHTIDTAKACSLIDRVAVTTDDPEIAAIAQKYGAHVVWRPDAISTDTASSEAARLHALDELAAQGYNPDLTVFLQCTAPLLSAADISGVMNTLLEQQADSALSAVPFHYFIWNRSKSGMATGINHDPRVRPMRQEREPQYLETGAIYVMRTAGFREAKHRFFGKTVLHLLPPERALEIDEPLDFEIAEIRLRAQMRETLANLLPDPVQALVMDFDGVLTDNSVIVREDGIESVRCNRSDGASLALLRKAGIHLLLLSAETNPVVRARAEKLGLPCLQTAGDKWAALEPWLRERNVAPSATVYVGNDFNDVSCLQAVGCGFAVADALPEARAAARAMLSANGGHGAVREVADMILAQMTHQPGVISRPDK